MGYFFNLNAEMSLLGHFLGYYFQCLGSLCTFYFIYTIVSVQYIVQIYEEFMQSNIQACGVNH